MPNLNDFNRLYRRTVKIQADGTDPIRLELDTVHPQVLRKLTHVTVENTGDGYTKCRLGIQRSGRDHYLDELTDVAQNELAVSRSDILLGEGDIFFSQLTGTDDGSQLIMTCVGTELDLK